MHIIRVDNDRRVSGTAICWVHFLLCGVRLIRSYGNSGFIRRSFIKMIDNSYLNNARRAAKRDRIERNSRSPKLEQSLQLVASRNEQLARCRLNVKRFAKRANRGRKLLIKRDVGRARFLTFFRSEEKTAARSDSPVSQIRGGFTMSDEKE